MPYRPQSQDQIYESLRARVRGRTERLTNFEPGSLNHTLLYHGYSGYFSRYEHALLAMQLSGWIETAGGPITEEDLIRLDLPPEIIDLDLLNSFMDDQDLDELALQNGVTRDPGGRATGEVVFMTNDENTVVPQGTEVATSTDQFTDEALTYRTTHPTRPEPGTTGATAAVEAVAIGPEYNVGAGAIDTMPSPPAGVRDVTNQTPITGGEPPETNAELRERAKESITQRSGGGTANGIKGGIVERVDGVDADNVHIDEHYDPPSGPPYVAVTVDGGSDVEVEQAIDALRPTGIRHILNRPTRYLIDATVDLAGSPINLDRVEGEIARYLSELGIGEDVNRAALITAIMNADQDIANIESLTLRSDRTGVIHGDLELDPDEKAAPGDITVSV